MRLYDDPVDVRRGRVVGTEGPEQFLWKGRLWKVSAVVAHWVETGAWWQSRGVHAVLGADGSGADGSRADGSGADGSGADGADDLDDRTGLPTERADLSAEREVWRVEADRGMSSAQSGSAPGVFDLVFDWTDGSWRLARCLD
jgi:Domain of unknown function (DUF6504)